jgi:hypothetical protein
MSINANTLSDKVVFANYFNLVRKYSNQWVTNQTSDRVNFLQKITDLLTKAIGIPNLAIDTSSKINDILTIGQFDGGSYDIVLNKDRIGIRTLKEANGVDSTS